jgi:hypothetical protein
MLEYPEKKDYKDQLQITFTLLSISKVMWKLVNS